MARIQECHNKNSESKLLHVTAESYAVFRPCHENWYWAMTSTQTSLSVDETNMPGSVLNIRGPTTQTPSRLTRRRQTRVPQTYTPRADADHVRPVSVSAAAEERHPSNCDSREPLRRQHAPVAWAWLGRRVTISGCHQETPTHRGLDLFRPSLALERRSPSSIVFEWETRSHVSCLSRDRRPIGFRRCRLFRSSWNGALAQTLYDQS